MKVLVRFYKQILKVFFKGGGGGHFLILNIFSEVQPERHQEQNKIK